MSNFEPVEPGSAFQAHWGKWQKQLREWRQAYDEWRQVLQTLQEWDEKDSKGIQLASIDPNLDVFAIDNILDIGEGEPLFGNFEYEDWLLLSTKVELHLLVHHFRDDTGGAVLDESNLAHYYKTYFNKDLTPADFAASSAGEVIQLAEDVVCVENTLLEHKFPEDTNFLHFLKLQARRERLQALEAGDETVTLTFPGAEREREAKKAAKEAKESQPPQPPSQAQPPRRRERRDEPSRREARRDRESYAPRTRFEGRRRDSRERTRDRSRKRDRRSRERDGHGSSRRGRREADADKGNGRSAPGQDYERSAYDRRAGPTPPLPERERSAYGRTAAAAPRRDPPATAYSRNREEAPRIRRDPMLEREGERATRYGEKPAPPPPRAIGAIGAAPLAPAPRVGKTLTPSKIPAAGAKGYGKVGKGRPARELDPLDAFMAGMEQHGEAFATGEVAVPERKPPEPPRRRRVCFCLGERRQILSRRRWP
ncbi:unnamed protein product [Effrenium voratum]|nr:unnamed protein product [Effrenium voratum]